MCTVAVVCHSLMPWHSQQIIAPSCHWS